MSTSLIVKDDIFIHANTEAVWEVLINPKYVSEWDELPEGYSSEMMTEGSKVIWDLPNGGTSTTTIIAVDENIRLTIALNVTNWEETIQEGEIAYHYLLESKDGGTLLRMEIGDFSLISDGQMYYDASVEFAETAKVTIKELAEKL